MCQFLGFLKYKQMFVHYQKKVVKPRFFHPETSCAAVVLDFYDILPEDKALT